MASRTISFSFSKKCIWRGGWPLINLFWRSLPPNIEIIRLEAIAISLEANKESGGLEDHRVPAQSGRVLFCFVHVL